MLDTENEDNEKNAQNAKTWSNYVDRLTNPVPTNAVNPQSSGLGARSTKNSCDEITLPIKEEKLDDDLVSGFFCC